MSPSLFAIHKRQDSRNDTIRRLHGINGTERGTAGGDDVFDDSYAIAASEGALEQSAGSVTFCLLSHGECSERMTGPGAGVADRIRDGVGTQRQPADGIDTPIAFSKDESASGPMIERPSGLIVVSLASI